MAKIAMIGAGSQIFCKTLAMDIFATPALQASEIPLKYGVDQCIGDTLGPGGIFRGLRTVPVLADMVRDMEELCPGALLLNYANPMAGCCVEVPVYVDRLGLHPVSVGMLPPQCAALNQSNVSVQTLMVEAALSGDPELAMQAVAMDPLTSACCTLKEIRDMTAEMLEAERQWLPQFERKKLRPTPVISVPKDVKRVEVPLDPALAIVHRFGELATRRI